ncbi:MAG: hypothetical protein P4M08_04530 [Oligoflexia bacterium]|nr:hypothetical protein [Oligoflexia bacterium]
MKVQSVALSVLVLFSQFAFAESVSPANNDVHDTVEKIIQLSKASESEDAACRSFIKSLQGQTRDSERKEFFVSRASTVTALEKVDQYPGTPLATVRALDEFLFLPALPSGDDADKLHDALARLSHCHSVEYYGILTRLIDPRSRDHLNASEKTLLRQYMISYLKRESEGGARFFFQVEELAALLNQGVHNGLFPASVVTRSAIDDLNWEIAKTKKESGPAFADNQTLSDAQSQLAKADDFRLDFQDVLDLELDDLYKASPERGTQLARLR